MQQQRTYVGSLLRDLRRRQDLHQKDVASRYCCSQQWVSLLENGERSLSLESVEPYAVALGIDTWELLKAVFDTPDSSQDPWLADER